MTAERCWDVATEFFAKEIRLNNNIATHHAVEELHFSLAKAELSRDNVRGVRRRTEKYLRSCLTHNRTKLGIARIKILCRSEEGNMDFTSLLHHLANRTCLREILVLELVNEHVQSKLRVIVLIINERCQKHIYDLVARFRVSGIRANNNYVV